MTYLFSKNKGKYLDAYLEEELRSKRDWHREELMSDLTGDNLEGGGECVLLNTGPASSRGHAQFPACRCPGCSPHTSFLIHFLAGS